MKFSAVVAIYNNESTIGHIIKTLQKHQDIGEIIAIDDHSQDKSPQILSRFKNVRCVLRPINLGKAAGIVDGWKMSRYPNILTVDGDLAKLSTDHLNALIDAYKSGKWDMIIGWHDPHSILDWVSGQRLYKKSAVTPFAEMAYRLGNGIEQVINFAHKDKRIGFVHTLNIGHILKYQRSSLPIAAWQYAKEGWQLLKAEIAIRTFDFAGII